MATPNCNFYLQPLFATHNCNLYRSTARINKSVAVRSSRLAEMYASAAQTNVKTQKKTNSLTDIGRSAAADLILNASFLLCSSLCARATLTARWIRIARVRFPILTKALRLCFSTQALHKACIRTAAPSLRNRCWISSHLPVKYFHSTTFMPSHMGHRLSCSVLRAATLYGCSEFATFAR